MVYSNHTFPDPNWKPSSHRKQKTIEGYVDFDSSTIYVHEKFTYEETCSIFWHEIGHIVRETLCLPVTKKQEEAICNMFALGVTSVLFDNEFHFDYSKKRKLDIKK